MMAINTQVQNVCMEGEVGFVDMWFKFVGKYNFFMRDGLHLTGKGVAVHGCEFVRVFDEGTQRSTNKHQQKCSPIISENELLNVCA